MDNGEKPYNHELGIYPSSDFRDQMSRLDEIKNSKSVREA